MRGTVGCGDVVGRATSSTWHSPNLNCVAQTRVDDELELDGICVLLLSGRVCKLSGDRSQLPRYRHVTVSFPDMDSLQWLQIGIRPEMVSLDTR